MALHPELPARLDSWKDIAAYLDREVRTVMRWEKSRGLPVRRMPGETRSTVYALKTEIDAWMLGQTEAVPADDPQATSSPTSSAASGPASEERPQTLPGARKQFAWVYVPAAMAAVSLCGGLLAAIRPWSTVPSLTATNPRRITLSQTRILSPLLAASDIVYFPQFENGRYSMASVPADGGQSVAVATDVPNPDLCDVATHSRSILLRSVVGYRDDAGPLYVQPPLSPARRVGNISVNDVVWYPDERRILYSADKAVFVTDLTGKTPQRLFEAPGIAFWFRWGTDGRTLRYTVLDHTNHLSLWQTRVDVGDSHGADLPTRLFANIPADLCCGAWTPDGSHFLFQYRVDSVFQIWAHRETTSALRFGSDKPFPLLAGAMSYRGPAVSPDNQRLYLRTEIAKAELMRLDRATGKFLPFLPSLPVRTVAFSRDGSRLAYTSLADDQLWRCFADGARCAQMTSGLKRTILPRWSPDGRSIAFMGLQADGGWAVMLISADGGQARPLSDLRQSQGDPDWSPDSRRLVFGNVMPALHQGGISILDIATGRTETLPGSEDLYAPHWSPDGRSIVALHVGDQHLYRHEFKQGGWTELTRIGAGYPNWSHDGKSIYFMAIGDPTRQLYRVAIANAALEKVVALSAVQRGSFFMSDWTGLAPDDAPLVLHNLTAEDIYAWDLARP